MDDQPVLRVRDLMTEGVFAVAESDSLETVRDLMDRRAIRHAPVVAANGAVAGLISQRDLPRLLRWNLPPAEVERIERNLRAAEIMTREVVTVGPDEDIRRAARILLEHKIGCLPVVLGQRLVGIITEADFVRFLAAGD